jgi:hypothetical protein
MTFNKPVTTPPEAVAKFTHPDWTAKGEPRACVPLARLETLWFNTGSLCNIKCDRCYIESSPTNVRLVFMGLKDVQEFLDEVSVLYPGTAEIGFTGGEPFIAREIISMLEEALLRGFRVLILTNAMAPMQRPTMKDGLLRLLGQYGERLTIRVSVDHYASHLHESERGGGTWQSVMAGVDWLVESGFSVTIAGRTCWGESEPALRSGYEALFAAHDWPIDAGSAAGLVLFPEMDEQANVPEITTACWGILRKPPSSVMCATSRMVVKRQDAPRPTVMPCTLLPYAVAFEMGSTLAEAAAIDGGMFEKGAVKLCHPHCAKFCVLGGGSCSV